MKKTINYFVNNTSILLYCMLYDISISNMNYIYENSVSLDISMVTKIEKKKNFQFVKSNKKNVHFYIFSDLRLNYLLYIIGLHQYLIKNFKAL